VKVHQNDVLVLARLKYSVPNVSINDVDSIALNTAKSEAVRVGFNVPYSLATANIRPHLYALESWNFLCPIDH